MEEYQVSIEYTFVVNASIKAESREEAERILTEQCALVGAKFVTDNKEQVIGWDVDLTPEEYILNSEYL